MSRHENIDTKLTGLRSEIEELGWTLVSIPKNLNGGRSEGEERMWFCVEQFGPCALSKVDQMIDFDPSKGWAAFVHNDTKAQLFFFKDPNEAVMFKIARA